MRKGSIHIVQRMAPGGIETLALDLVRSGDGHDRILSLDGNAADLIAAWPALQAVAGRLEAFGAAAGFKPGLVLRLARRLYALKPQAVFLHHIGPLLYGGIAARLARVPRIVHVEHDVWHYGDARHKQITAWIERLVRPHHVAVSRNAADAIHGFLETAAVSVIPNGIDLDRFRPGDKSAARKAFGLDPAWRIVGTAGRLVPVKAHDVLIRAAALLPGDCHVVIAGSGPEMAALRHCAIENGVERRVHFTGHVDKVETVLPAFDVFCLPSHAEGFPRSVIEAQAARLPVVATDVGALAEAVCPSTGRIVPPGDPAALAAALAEVLALPDSGASRQFVEARFSWTDTVASYRRVMEVGHAA